MTGAATEVIFGASNSIEAVVAATDGWATVGSSTVTGFGSAGTEALAGAMIAPESRIVVVRAVIFVRVFISPVWWMLLRAAFFFLVGWWHGQVTSL
jgi:hypothetical protein